MEQNTPPVPVVRKSIWGRIKSLLVFSSLLGLGGMNIATLVSEQIHNAGYGVLKSILGSIASETAASKMLSNSAVMRRKSDVALATKKIADEKLALTLKHAAIEKQRSEVVKRFSTRLAQRTVVNVTRNVSSIPGEAIPIIGTTLVVGVTAWDVYDACETMKDIKQLQSGFEQSVVDEKSVCGLHVPTKDEALAKVRSGWKSAYKQSSDLLGNVVSPTLPSITLSDVKPNLCPIVGGVFCY